MRKSATGAKTEKSLRPPPLMMMCITVVLVGVTVVVVPVTGAAHCTATAITPAGGFTRLFVLHKLDNNDCHQRYKGKRNEYCCKHITASFHLIF